MSGVLTQDTISAVSAIASADASSTFAAIRVVLRNPAANTTMSLLLLACAALLVLIVAIAVLMLVTAPRKKIVKVRRYPGTREEGMAAAAAAAARRKEAAVASQAAKKRDGRVMTVLTSTAAIVGLIVVGIVGAYAATSTDQYCAKTCHGGTSAEKTALAIDHSACVSCHEASWLNVPANLSSRSRMALAYYQGRSPKRTSGTVDPHACLDCHDEITEQTVRSGNILMSHKEVVSAGVPCTECHAGSGHRKTAFTATMDACVTCHDSKTAPSECDTCHLRDPASAGAAAAGSRVKKGSGAYEYPAVRAASRQCYGCHNPEKECDGCHGIRMPHTIQFQDGGHARAAAFDAKLRCWNCHDPQWCSNGGCHLALFQPDDGSTTHGRGWKQEHKGVAWGAGCGCHQGRTPRDYPICFRCHDEDHSLLPVTY